MIRPSLVRNDTATSNQQRRQWTAACPKYRSLQGCVRKLRKRSLPAEPAEWRFPSCHLTSVCRSLDHRRAGFGDHSSMPEGTVPRLIKNGFNILPSINSHSRCRFGPISEILLQRKVPNPTHGESRSANWNRNAIILWIALSVKFWRLFRCSLSSPGPTGKWTRMTFHSGRHGISVGKLHRGLPHTKN